MKLSCSAPAPKQTQQFADHGCVCVLERGEDGSKSNSTQSKRGRGKHTRVARKAETSRGALQRDIASCDGNPLVDVRKGARHADGRLGGLGSEHVLEEVIAAGAVMGFIST